MSTADAMGEAIEALTRIAERRRPAAHAKARPSLTAEQANTVAREALQRMKLFTDSSERDRLLADRDKWEAMFHELVRATAKANVQGWWVGGLR